MIALHAGTAIAALLLGAGVLMLRKGTRFHKILGRSWVALMLAVALSSFWITRDGSFSWTFMGLAGAGLGALAPGRLLHLLLFA